MLNKLLSQKALINTLLIAVVLLGVNSYLKIGKLEDAEIAIKTAIVVTQYPGATAHEVELEVTDVMEKALQKLENVDDISSRSLPGYSEITINMQTKVKSKDIPQVWDHLRRKVNDAKVYLPQGAREPIVVDDFGDVYGIFLAVTAEGYDYAEFKDYIDLIRREMLNVDGIKRIETFGTQTESVEVTFSSEKIAGLNVNPIMIIQAIGNEGEVVNPGSFSSGTDRIRISVGNKFSSLDEIENILVQVPDGGSFRLGDIAKVNRSFYQPKRQGLLYNGKPAISLALSMESGVNVIEIGDRFKEKLAELQPKLPAGVEINSVFSQPDRVKYSIKGFVINLIESVLIVLVVLLITMGLRSGLLIASGLIFTILGTFIVMEAMDIQLQRISLAAIIVAMGMLVDNSIVIADGIIIDLKRGIKREKAFTGIVKQTAIPLLGATIIAILAFLPLALSPTSAGEYLSSLFTVLAISLFLSWIFAMVQTPYMASLFYKKGIAKKAGKEHKDPYSSAFYIKFKNLIQWALSHKTLFLATSILLLMVALFSFRFVKFEFMPTLDYNQFLVEYKLARGTELETVEKDLKEISDELLSWDEIYNVTAASGGTPARYTLIRPMAKSASNYGELVIDVEDYDASVVVGDKIIAYLKEHYPQATARKRVYGPIFTEYEVEAQFSGPDPAVLRGLAEEAKTIMRNEPKATAITDNWKNKVKVLNPQYSVERAKRANISRSNIANAIAIATDGLTVGAMSEGTHTLPISLKIDNTIEDDIDNISGIPVWSMNGKKSVPLSQVTDDIKLNWEDAEIYRYNGQRAILAQCDPVSGTLTKELEVKLKPQINAIELPDGYTLEWHGSGKKSGESQSSLFAALPLALGIMLIIVIALFNNGRQAGIIFTIFPFALMGIVVGFLTTGATLNFIGLIGALGLIGMMIKNTIVLLDEINHNLKAGLSQLQAIVDAAQSRLRPVILASATTILGMSPLLTDVMFKSMAITIIFGLLIGTIITLLVVPVMYAAFFKVDISPLKKQKAQK